jgi:membrane protein
MAVPEKRVGERGQNADTPWEIPKPGWKDILKRTKAGIREDHITIVAGGVSFFTLLGIIPALVAVISIYGLFAAPGQIQEQFNQLAGVVPAEAHQLLSEQMQQISRSSKSAGWGAAIGILLALWGGSKAVKALVEGLNIMFDVEEKRGFLKLNLVAVLLTLAGVVGVVIAVGLIAVLPAAIGALGLGETGETLVSILRWPLLLVFFLLALAVMYRFAPCREEPKWRWVTWGAVAATALWLAVSGLFSLYVANFNSYNKTYGSLGAVVILLMWFYITAYVVLLGAELDSEMERQTAKDTRADAPSNAFGQRPLPSS